MRQIEVDTDVFAAIWSLREPGEDSENAILRRVLYAITTSKAPNRIAILSSARGDSFEAKSSKQSDQSRKAEEMEMGKIRWVDDVRIALTLLGGRAPLEKIYKAVEDRRHAGGRSTPRTLDAVIRRTLEDHSSDSANFRGNDLFRLIGRGEWALR